MTEDTVQIADPEQFPEARRLTRGGLAKRIVILSLLIALLAALAFTTWYYLRYRKLPIPRVTGVGEEVLPPEYVFSINGPAGSNSLLRPIGTVVGKDDLVYAVDTRADVVRVYDTEGRYQFTFGDEELTSPAHLAVDAEDNVYVSDRTVRAVLVFTPEGTLEREIALPDDEGAAWGPLGMGFDSEGNLYVTDVGNTDFHRVVVFDPQGNEIRRWGSTARAQQITQFPSQFYFPNGVAISSDNRLFVSDSDNRRVQVFSLEGEFQYFIETSGIPRGIVIDDEDRLYVVDALAHTVDIYNLDGDRLTGFGENGRGPGQFRYPDDISLDSVGRIYVSDRENHQIQVWAWPEGEIDIPEEVRKPLTWALCLAPLLLLPLLLLLRRRKIVVLVDFVDEMAAMGKVPTMDTRKFKWQTPEAIWPSFDGRVEDGVDLGQLIVEEPHSDSEARDLMRRLAVTYDEAALLVVARRAKRLATQDVHLASLAAALGVDVYDARRFVEEFGAEPDSDQNRPGTR